MQASRSQGLYLKSKQPRLFVERGTVKFRTKLVRDRDLAIRFAKCISHNRRFVSAEVQQSAQAKGRGFFVTYQPANPERQAELVTRLQAERVRRAQEEREGYFWQECSGYAFCLSGSGREYRVSSSCCSCEDFTNTCAPLGILCKHVISYQMKFGGKA